MRYATAIWNYAEPHVKLVDLVQEFVGFGYDTISFLPGQLLGPPEEAQQVADYLRADNLLATLHGNFDMSADEAARIIDLLGDMLLTFTCDAVMASDSRGSFYDVRRMADFLLRVLEMGEATGLRVAIEDMPLDDAAIDFYRADFEPLLASDRYGILIDVGHLNLRCSGGGYFGGMSVAEYIDRVPLPIIEVHLHDNHGEKDEHGHFGLGNLNFRDVATALKARGFDGISTIEIAPTFHGNTPTESKPLSRDSLAQWKELWENG